MNGAPTHTSTHTQSKKNIEKKTPIDRQGEIRSPKSG